MADFMHVGACLMKQNMADDVKSKKAGRQKSSRSFFNSRRSPRTSRFLFVFGASFVGPNFNGHATKHMMYPNSAKRKANM